MSADLTRHEARHGTAETRATIPNPPTRVGVHSLLFLCSIQKFGQNVKSKIPSPPNSKNLQNPKSKIPKIQNPKSPKSKIQTLHIKICYIMFQKSKIQNPQNPKSNIPKIQNPKSPKSPKSKIQNPQSPKSKIPKIQNPQSPTSKIQNSKSPPKSKIWGVGASHKELLHNDPKSKIQNPQNLAKKVWIGDFGFWILDLGFRPQNPKSKLPKIQNPKSPKSKIPNPQNPKSKIQNPQNPKSKILRWNPKFGALGASRKELLHNDPKSKIPKIRPKKFGFWILGILDFGFWGFWILDFGILGILDFGLWGFWILAFGILGILDFGFWMLGILDFGDFGFWILGILGILDFGFWGFGGFWILDFGILGRSRGCTWRSEARIPPGLPLGATSKLSVSHRIGVKIQGEKYSMQKSTYEGENA